MPRELSGRLRCSQLQVSDGKVQSFSDLYGSFRSEPLSSETNVSTNVAKARARPVVTPLTFSETRLFKNNPVHPTVVFDSILCRRYELIVFGKTTFSLACDSAVFAASDAIPTGIDHRGWPGNVLCDTNVGSRRGSYEAMLEMDDCLFYLFRLVVVWIISRQR